jgi:hypothetical protein
MPRQVSPSLKLEKPTKGPIPLQRKRASLPSQTMQRLGFHARFDRPWNRIHSMWKNRQYEVLPTSMPDSPRPAKMGNAAVLIRFFFFPEPDGGGILSWRVVLTRAELSVLTFTTAQPSAGAWGNAEKKF